MLAGILFITPYANAPYQLMNGAPSYIPSLITPIIEDCADMVMGSRVLGSIEPGAMFPQHRFSNWLVSRLINLICGLSITDLGPYCEICRSLLVRLDM